MPEQQGENDEMNEPLQLDDKGNRFVDAPDTGPLLNEIAKTQRVVLKFVNIFHRMNHETGDHNEP